MEINEFEFADLRRVFARKILQLVEKSGEGHIPSALSILDIVYAIYFFEKSKNSNLKDLNFILSKGHGALALYVVLNHFKLISDEVLASYCASGSKIVGHPTRNIELGVVASTGSLGHGLPITIGTTLGGCIRQNYALNYVLIGDGECNEGTIWESLLLGTALNLTNIICFVDMNRSSNRSIPLGELHKKFKSFDWEVLTIDGHNFKEILETLNNFNSKKPLIVICNTTKGKGIKSMEDDPSWHHRIPNSIELSILDREIGV